jgi:hypothetical protein
MEGEGEGGGRAKLIRSREEYGWRESKREGEDQRESDRRERKGGRRREIVASLVLSSSLSLTLPHHNTHTHTHTHTHTYRTTSCHVIISPMETLPSLSAWSALYRSQQRTGRATYTVPLPWDQRRLGGGRERASEGAREGG